MSKTFLGKSGKIFGPFSDTDVARMRSDGELERFSWIWQATTPGWQAIDPPPPPVVEGTGMAELQGHSMPPMPRQAPPTPPQRKSLKIVSDAMDAICHDYRHAVAGRIVRMTDSGCELVANGQGGKPDFQDHAKLYLNLLNAKAGKTMDVVAMLSGVSRSKEGWTYRLEWESVPEILAG